MLLSKTTCKCSRRGYCLYAVHFKPKKVHYCKCYLKKVLVWWDYHFYLLQRVWRVCPLQTVYLMKIHIVLLENIFIFVIYFVKNFKRKGKQVFKLNKSFALGCIFMDQNIIIIIIIVKKKDNNIIVLFL